MKAVDAQFVKRLMDHQKEAGVFKMVSGLVERSPTMRRRR
jgi:hypothetical protein